MAGENAVNLRACEENIRVCEEQLLRCHIESAAAAKINLTDDQLVELLLSAFPQSYSRRDRKDLIKRVAKITPLPCRRDDAIDDATNKRRKIDAARNASGENEVLSSSASANCPQDSRRRELYQSNRNELEKGEKEVNENADDANVKRKLAVTNELGDGRRKMNKDGDGGWRDGSGDNRPMLSDLYGMNKDVGLVDMLRKEVIVPLHQLKLVCHFGVEPPVRILLHGPPGCGKTTVARAIANEAGVPFYEISAAELVSGVSGAPEKNIRELFSTAYMRAPSIVFIDKIEPHIVNQLMPCMDEAYSLAKPVHHNADSESSNSRPGYVLVIGATNSPNSLDPALQQWFDHKIAIPDPDEKARLDILSALTRNLKAKVGFDLAQIAMCTMGFVAGDLVALVKETCKVALNRTIDGIILQPHKEQSVEVQLKDCYRQTFSDEDLEYLIIIKSDFLDAAKKVQPSSKIEKFSSTEIVKWDDVVGLQSLKLDFERHIIKHIKFPEVYKNLAIGLITKFFLYDPPGCGKTMIVEALANEAGAKLIHVEFLQLLIYGAQIGLVVKNLFRYARTCSPCILFFDGLTWIPIDEEEEEDKGPWSWLDNRQILEMLISAFKEAEEEGPLGHVFVIGATDRAHFGRYFPLIHSYFDKIMYVPLPSPEERGETLKALARNKPIDAKVDLMALGRSTACENLSNLHLVGLMAEACGASLARPSFSSGGCSERWTVKDKDFKYAFTRIDPITPRSEIEKYEHYFSKLKHRLRGSLAKLFS